MDADRADRMAALANHYHDHPLAPVVRELLTELARPIIGAVPASDLEVARAREEAQALRDELDAVHRDYATTAYGHVIAVQNEQIAQLRGTS